MPRKDKTKTLLRKKRPTKGGDLEGWRSNNSAKHKDASDDDAADATETSALKEEEEDEEREEEDKKKKKKGQREEEQEEVRAQPPEKPVVIKRAPGPRVKRSDGRFPCDIFDSIGSCKFGDKCKFSHLGTDDTGLPEGVASKKKDKVPVCREWQEGTCKYDGRCRFAHGEDAAAQVEALSNREKRDPETWRAKQDYNRLQNQKLSRIMKSNGRQDKQKVRAVFFNKQKRDASACSASGATGKKQKTDA